MRQDLVSYVQDYRGVLGWTTYTQSYQAMLRPAVEIPLYIKDHPIPQRKMKFSEVNTMQQIDPYSGMDTSIHAVFEGAPDLLSVSISGFIITTYSSHVWQILDTGGSLLNVPNMSYSELIEFFINGYMDVSAGGVPQRRDPDYYITPYGQRYNFPQIASYEFSSTPNPKKHQFSMQLWLER